MSAAKAVPVAYTIFTPLSSFACLSAGTVPPKDEYPHVTTFPPSLTAANAAEVAYTASTPLASSACLSAGTVPP